GKPADLTKEPYSTRRTVYGFIDRSDVADVMVNFDFANPDLPSGRRHETTVPQQALFLMNSPLVVEQAKKLVALPEFAKCEDDKAKVTFLYDRIFQRLPRPEEILLGQDFITEKPEPEKVVSADPLAQPVAFDGDARKKFGKQQGKKQMARAGGPGF